jgi:hypothetical protein
VTRKISDRLFRSFSAIRFALQKAYPNVKVVIMRNGILSAVGGFPIRMYPVSSNDN